MARHVLEDKDGSVRVHRRYYELCVLQQLERALKCKEIWVEGSYAFRNPHQDLPTDWHHEAQRVAYYRLLPQPVEVTAFLDPLRDRLSTALTQFNRDLPRNPYVHLYPPPANNDRRLLAVARLMAQPEPQSLDRIKDLIGQHYGLLDLLDLFVEADRLTGFTQCFTHSGTKEVRPREALRPLLLLDLFAEGTNTGIKRVARANHQYSYDELLYVRKHYISVEALRHANTAVVNNIWHCGIPSVGRRPRVCLRWQARRELAAEPDDRVAFTLSRVRGARVLARRDQCGLPLLTAPELLVLRSGGDDRGLDSA